MHFTSPDDMQSHLLEKIKRQLTQCENDLEMAQRQLKSEKAKNKRLTTKYNALEKKFETAAQMECTGCGLTSPARWKITRKKTTTVVSIHEIAICARMLITTSIEHFWFI